MNERPDNPDTDKAVEQAAEHSDRATQERQEMARKSSLADAAEDTGERSELERQAEDHREAAYDEEQASAERPRDDD